MYAYVRLCKRCASVAEYVGVRSLLVWRVLLFTSFSCVFVAFELSIYCNFLLQLMQNLELQSYKEIIKYCSLAVNIIPWCKPVYFDIASSRY